MITIAKGIASAKTLEGIERSLSLAKLISHITPPQLDLVLPTGVKMIVQRGRHFMAVYEIKPGAYQLKWQDEPEEGKYPVKKLRTFALPYVILLLPFWIDKKSQLVPLNLGVECYYRNEPLTDVKDKLFYPALLNCGPWNSLNLLSWMCASNMSLASLNGITDNNKRLWKSIGLLRDHFFGASFNWEWPHRWKNYRDWEKKDERITNLDTWEKETAKDPSFILNVEWMPAQKNLKDTIDYTLGQMRHLTGQLPIVNAAQMGSIILNNGTK